MNAQEIMTDASNKNASDVFIIAGLPVTFKINGVLERQNETPLKPEDCTTLVKELYALSHTHKMTAYEERGDDDFSFSIPGVSRYRASAFRQRGSEAAVVRVIAYGIKHAQDLAIPDAIMTLTDMNKGLVLITGSTGTGKSTTLACMIDRINRHYSKHIITLEDPIEHLHSHKKSIVTQREILIDTIDYPVALRAALRQSPDVLLIGEMRDLETISIAMTAAETGHLVFSTLHTIGAADTIDRIIDVFPPSQQRQITVQLSMCLRAVVSQTLVPAVDGSLVPAFEIMTVTPAISNMIRDGKIAQISGLVYSSNRPDLMALDTSLYQLYTAGTITEETALMYATNPEMLKKRMKI